MANEITVGVTVEANKSDTKVSRSVTSKKENQAGAGGGGPGQLTITSGAEVTVDLTGYGRIVIENLDSTNFVKWGFATTVYKGKLNPGGAATTLYLMAGTTLYLRADTADCEIRITAVTS